jgi:L,D-peptidoglycan transpeptidase YkuD (ErfK/YbiS/YcfS/YnhG family)
VTDIIVHAAQKILEHQGIKVPCLIGETGAITADAKREGDGATPFGRWPIRAALLRPDRIASLPGMALPWRWLRPEDGWCDDPQDAAYNRPVRHPYPRSAERLWREDGAYDVILVLGHNDRPPKAAMGSAIFLHCTADRAFTEGCVAITKADLLNLLPLLTDQDAVEIR